MFQILLLLRRHVDITAESKKRTEQPTILYNFVTHFFCGLFFHYPALSHKFYEKNVDIKNSHIFLKFLLKPLTLAVNF